MNYKKVLVADHWVITDADKDYLKPVKTDTFAIDTETLTYLDGKIQTQEAIADQLKDCDLEAKRARLSNKVWSWQCYDELNGFFMTDDFYLFLGYIAQCKGKFGWCYNATFDFAQIDYQLLSDSRWAQHVFSKTAPKRQPWSYNSVNNDMGSRYCYKLWVPFRNNSNRQNAVHSLQFRDFMKFLGGGLKAVLSDLDVKDNNGIPVRKLEMAYQNVEPGELSQAEIDYCCNDVKGLYFAVKKFNQTIEQKSAGESHIFGPKTNLMTAGGFAKKELLRSLYPGVDPNFRIKIYQKDHPLTLDQDQYFRANNLYRGGISFVNPRYKGVLLTEKMMGRKMNRFDVNSEYPFAMDSIRDLIGAPMTMTLANYSKLKNKNDFEAIYVCTSIRGKMKPNMLPIWYDAFKKKYTKNIDELGVHLLFEREINEMKQWYDFQSIEVDKVILFKRGDFCFKNYVESNYADKAAAKKAGNKVLQKVAKLLLNSAYGKLAERVNRGRGHFGLNSDTGAVHYVDDGDEIDTKGMMSVAVGSLVTSFARCFILSKIREICAPNVSKAFVYIDTDSIHCFSDYAKADAFKLGELKLEAQCPAVKYLLPKTYVDIEKINDDGTIDAADIEVHTKGVAVKAVMAGLLSNKKLTVDSVNNELDYGKKYTVLQAINVVGGKVLVPVEKYLARPELRPKEQLIGCDDFLSER